LLDGPAFRINEEGHVMHDINSSAQITGAGKRLETGDVAVDLEVAGDHKPAEEIPIEPWRDGKSSGRVGENEVRFTGFPVAIIKGPWRRQVGRVPFRGAGINPLDDGGDLLRGEPARAFEGIGIGATGVEAKGLPI
jgi:hypothetical protein